jgi:hypothetical protein
MWDVTVSDTLARTYVSHTANAAGYAGTTAEGRKRAKYEPVPQGYDFYPLAFETLGSWGVSTADFIRDLCSRLRKATGDVRAGAFFLQRLSLHIVRGNAASVLQEMSSPDVYQPENIPIDLP